MPYYIFAHPKKKNKYIEVFQHMNDDHSYTDEAGVKWNRVFTKPQAAVDTKIDEFNSQQFIEKTGSKKGTLGDMFDRSKELSLKREQRAGRDDIKENYYQDYSKKRKGAVHPDQKRAKAKNELSKHGIEVEL